MLTTNLFNSIWGFTSPSSKVTRYSSELYLWSIGGACLIFGEQNLITKSMQYNTVGSVQLIMYLLIPFGYFLDWLVVGQ